MLLADDVNLRSPERGDALRWFFEEVRYVTEEHIGSRKFPSAVILHVLFTTNILRTPLRAGTAARTRKMKMKTTNETETRP